MVDCSIDWAGIAAEREIAGQLPVERPDVLEMLASASADRPLDGQVDRAAAVAHLTLARLALRFDNEVNLSACFDLDDRL